MQIVHAEEPWRVDQAFNLPQGFRLSGETRMRYETLEGQFREGLAGSDQLLLFRSLLKAELDTGAVTWGAEIQDSRTYLGDEGTPLSNSFVNAADFLQLYAKTDLGVGLGEGGRTEVILGRQTVSIGSKRQIERVSFANVIKSYTGLHLTSKSARGDELHVLGVVPIDRLPKSRDEVFENALSADEEQWKRKIYGLHYRRKDAFSQIASEVWAEAFVYGLHEEDEAGTETPNRRYVTPGGRLYKARKVGQWDWDIEGALRIGSRRASSARSDTEDLDVFASQLIARIGYTFDGPWEPNIAVQYYWASGDKDPDDDQYDQYERLFGGRRTDLNNTSIHGPLTPANLSAPGIRIEVAPSARTDARLHYSAAALASDTDTFIIAKRRDPSGNTGHFMGHTIDGRFRYHLRPDSITIDIGASAFLFGEVLTEAIDPPQDDYTLFGYSQIIFKF